MDITALTTTPARAASSTTTTPRAEADFATFLTLLTTQLRNQDPLKPLESTEFVAQLASFSAVEQQVRTNTLLEAMATADGGGAASLAGWIGADVGAARPANFSDRPIDLRVAPAPGADTARLVVRDAGGSIVGTEALDLAVTDITWAGKATGGDPLPAGTYTFSVESYRGDAVIATSPATVYGRVTEARLDQGSPVLVFDDGSATPAANVVAIRGAPR
jgi:flagellar basal-body rod modification protein FlgD